MDGFPSDLICSVCIKVYDNVSPPIFLPGCGHSFCRLCLLDQTILSGNAFSCPLCKYVHQFMDVDSLKVNYSLLNVAQQLSTGSPMKKQNSIPLTHTEQLIGLSVIQENSSYPFTGQPIYQFEWIIRCVTSDTQLNQEKIMDLYTPSHSNGHTQSLDQPRYRLEWRVRCVTSDIHFNQEQISRLATPSSSISEDLNCSVCIEVYGYTSLPICLPGCGHSFCLSCLLDLTKQHGNAFPCPSCRSVHRGIPVVSLNVNYALLNIAQQLNEQSSMRNQNYTPFAQSEEVYNLTEMQEHSFTPFAGQSTYLLQWRVRSVTPDTQLNQEQIPMLVTPSSANKQDQLLDQPTYRLEWKLSRVTSDSQLNQEQIPSLVIPSSSKSEEESFVQGSSVNHTKIKNNIKKMLLKSKSFVTDIIN